MRLICEFCQIPVRPGERVVTDGVSSVAHEHCVKKEADPTAIHLPSVTVSPPLPAPPSLHKPDDTLYRAMNAGIPIPKTNVVEPCLLPRAPSLCVECQKPAISMCPGCHAYVCQDYGYNGKNCSGRHEMKCEGARRSRDPIGNLEKAAISIGAAAIFGRNGVHKVEKKVLVDRKKRGRR